MPAANEPAASMERDIQDYDHDVLLLAEGQVEGDLDESIEFEAQKLGLTLWPRPGTTRRTRASTCESFVTALTDNAGTESTDSRNTHSTALTSLLSSNEDVRFRNVLMKNRPATTTLPLPARSDAREESIVLEDLDFSPYDRFIQQAQPPPLLSIDPARPASARPEPSLFSVSTRRSYASVKQSLKNRFSMARKKSMPNIMTCSTCPTGFQLSKIVHPLPCAHSHCEYCLQLLINQSIQNEAQMPPKCCDIPISTAVIKDVLLHEEQVTFLDAVAHYSTPWSDRIYCASTSCGAFIAEPYQLNPRAPFEVTCAECDQTVCSICKAAAHDVGQHCPADWELETMTQLGQDGSWKRCYQCRTLVNCQAGSEYMECQCGARFCQICNAIWDGTRGLCPNSCNADAEIMRRRLAEEERLEIEWREAKEREETARAAAKEEADALERTRMARSLQDLRTRHVEQRDRFLDHDRRRKWALWARHGKAKLAILDHYSDLEKKMRERHVKTSAHLEDRQVAAEMELRAALKQAERSMRIKLKHMEAYCAGLGKATGPAGRMVTERDLRELGIQYHIRDDMERLHQSKINVMRDKQTQQMQALVQRQEEELERLNAKQSEDLDQLIERCTTEEDEYARLTKARRDRLDWRWASQEMLERRRLEIKGGWVRYAEMDRIEWPAPVVEKVAVDDFPDMI